ncbi:MAG: hypothetical protein JW715_05705 [Sedimentisphaerales bacterium]|nr:hypothetical protein [Sedimentisphaerales bacterium]
MKISGQTISNRRQNFGSALILAVVLSSLLAMVGVLFVLVARMNKMATSSVAENMELDFAVDTVTATITQQLASDIPDIEIIRTSDPNDPNAPVINSNIERQEYYDYPDANNLWLASLEPYKSGSDYYWRQISDLTGSLAGLNRNVKARIISEYAPISDSNETNADADGDGVGDSRWIKLDEIASSRGEAIYAAIRIIDNGAMLNVNTAYKFDPCDPNAGVFDIDGTSQLQINLMSLAAEPGYSGTQAEEAILLWERANNGRNVNPLDLDAYARNVIWRYSDSNEAYTPFDISDELELRYRYILNHTAIDTRLESWSDRFRYGAISTPVTSGGNDLDAWFSRTAGSSVFDPNYTYRHIATIHNMDRIINPVGSELNDGKMINVNLADKNLLYAALRAGLRDDYDPNTAGADELAAQLAVNIVDHRDLDVGVSTLQVGSKMYYGFEAQPFINEIGFRISSDRSNVSTNNYFAVELYNPFQVDIPLADFRLEIRDANENIVDTITLVGYVISAGGRFVITSSGDATSEFGLANLISTGGGKEDPNLVLARYALVTPDPPAYELSEKYDIFLRRLTPVGQIFLDKQLTLRNWFDWDNVNGSSKYYCRNDNNWNVVYQQMHSADNTLGAVNGTLGTQKDYNIVNSIGSFATAGEIARVLTIGPSADPNDMIGRKLAAEPYEGRVRIDLQNAVFAGIFRYLTVIDPTVYGLPVEETRIKGRVNINTAPSFVMAQLPWMVPAIAGDVVTYRDTEKGAFKSIAEMMYVPQMGYYATDALDLEVWPDLTALDGAVDDFEERDIIFSRISNLVTVRSDVFTAYILVRIGINGPQRRVVAVFDRSQTDSGPDKVRIVAVHPVPDPR